MRRGRRCISSRGRSRARALARARSRLHPRSRSSPVVTTWQKTFPQKRLSWRSSRRTRWRSSRRPRSITEYAGDRYQVVVHVDPPVLADTDAPGASVLEDGTHVPAETSRRLACDASRVVMRHDADGNVAEIGARTRTI